MMTALTRQWPSEDVPECFYGANLDPNFCMTKQALNHLPLGLLVSHDFGIEVNPAQHTFFAFVRAIGLLLPLSQKALGRKIRGPSLGKGRGKKSLGAPLLVTKKERAKRKSITNTIPPHEEKICF